MTFQTVDSIRLSAYLEELRVVAKKGEELLGTWPTLFEENNLREQAACAYFHLLWSPSTSGSDAYSAKLKRPIELKAPTSGANGINVGELSESIVQRHSKEDHLFIDFDRQLAVRSAYLVPPATMMKKYNYWLSRNQLKGQKVVWSWVRANGTCLVEDYRLLFNPYG